VSLQQFPKFGIKQKQKIVHTAVVEPVVYNYLKVFKYYFALEDLGKSKEK